MSATTKKPNYGAENLISLTPIEHIRKRPNLTLGPYAFMQNVALREPIDNAIDEFRAGHGELIRVVINEDGSATIEDSGRGVPVDINSTTKENGIFMAFGKVGSGGKFGADDSGYAGTSSLGLNGVGTTATNATSRRFDVTVYRDGKEHRLSFREGLPGHFDGDNGPDDKFTPGMDIVARKDPRSAKEKKERPTGTTIKFWPDPTVFGPSSTFRINELRDSLRSTAFLIPGIKIEIDDRKGESAVEASEYEDGREAIAPQHDIFQFDGGIVEMLDLLAEDQPLHDPIEFKTFGSFSEKVPVPQKDGTVKNMVRDRKVDIDIAMRWGNGYDYFNRSFVNTISTPLGGTHIKGFEQAMSKVLIDNIKSTRGLLKPKEDAPLAEDVREGLSFIISINQSEPNFVGQDKRELGDSRTQRVIKTEVTKSLEAWIADKKNAATLKIIQQKIVEASRVRLIQRKEKEVARKSSALERSSMMPAKLVACGVDDPRYIELQLCEGDSALGGLREARDARYQAIFPLRGKPLNSQDISLGAALENAELSNIVQIIGAGVGKSFELDKMRYKRIIMLADADADGSHIRVLLIAFFYRFMRPLVEAGRLYAAMPPLFSVTTTGKNPEKLYAMNQEELDKIIARLDKSRKGYKKPQRHKGLGEYSADTLSELVMDPRTRTLRRITVEEAHMASEMLELALGSAAKGGANRRKQWILDERDKVSDDEIDA